MCGVFPQIDSTQLVQLMIAACKGKLLSILGLGFGKFGLQVLHVVGSPQQVLDSGLNC